MKRLNDTKNHELDAADKKYTKLYQDYISTNDKFHKKIEALNKMYEESQSQSNDKTDKIVLLNN